MALAKVDRARRHIDLQMRIRRDHWPPSDADDPGQVLVINAGLGPDNDVAHDDLDAGDRLAPRRVFDHHRGKGGAEPALSGSASRSCRRSRLRQS
jgi:hypothetical protein